MVDLRALVTTGEHLEVLKGFQWIEAYKVNKRDYVSDNKKYVMYIEGDEELKKLNAKYLVHLWLQKAELDPTTLSVILAGLKDKWEDFRKAMAYVQQCLEPFAAAAKEVKVKQV
eukprot:jgi/Mesvir1/25764/Mv01940-RA.1